MTFSLSIVFHILVPLLSVGSGGLTTVLPPSADYNNYAASSYAGYSSGAPYGGYGSYGTTTAASTPGSLLSK